jgi:predicted Zn-dependent protease
VRQRRALICLTLLTCLALAPAGATLSAQTRVRPPPNKYTVAQDVQLGRQAAAQARQRLPMLHDAQVAAYVASVGRRLASAIPAELRHREFHYTFEVVNARDINAFALPGGPMFVNRGMLEAAGTEGQVAGVLAHELSHIVLRHGTAQASKATKYEIGSLAGAVIGAIIGGRVGAVVSQGTRIGLGTAFMRFSREFERQADIEGSHLMARAGYDPGDMAAMFQIIARRSGSGGPEWLSDHPNPGNRSSYISREARLLRVRHPVRDSQAFRATKVRLSQMPPAPSMQQITQR